MESNVVEYGHPEETEFFLKGFGLSSDHDPDECVNSFVYDYEDGNQLIITHSPSSDVSFTATLLSQDAEIFRIHQENVTGIYFEAWGDEDVIRVHFNSDKINSEFRVYYSPKPRIYVSNT